MRTLSARTSGTVIALLGIALAVVHLETVARLRASALVPLVVALIVIGMGALIREGELVPRSFADRTLAWTGVGTLALVLATGWLFVDASLRGQLVREPMWTMFDGATLGALVGLLVGIYDAREHHQRLRAEQLTRINDTLRIATQEMVDAADRAELEAVVCEHLTESGIYDGAWIGRYTPDDEYVRPVAWAEHDDEYIASLEVSVDPDDPAGQGPGGAAIRTGEIQPVQDVFDEPSLDPWWDLLAEKGVESMAVVPLVGAERVHGFLSVYANRANIFDSQEQEALSELGESIGHAIDSMAAREQLARRERDLTRQNERLDEFASVVSHDLRNPLTVAEGNLELVESDLDDDRLDRIADALDRMDELIDDLLTLARYGRTVSDVEPVDLRSVAENAWATTNTEHARLRFEGDPGTVEADESRLTQVFENLFRNSVEHGSTSNRTESGDSEASETPRATGEAGDSVEHGSTDNRMESGDSVEHGSTDNRTESGDSEASETPRATGEAGDSVVHGSTESRPRADDSAEHRTTHGPTTSDCASADAPADGAESSAFRRGGDEDPEVTITVGRTDDGFYVEDDGPGIPETEREKVFEAGYSTDPEGTGFGLNIVRTIAEAHGWEVGVTAGRAGGTRFEVTTTGAEANVPGAER